MKSHLRTSMFLLGLCVLGLLVAGLRLASQTQPGPPAGSSASAEPDGVEALYLWVQSLGGTPARLEQSAASNADVLFVVQPEASIGDADRQAFEQVAARGGTLIVAGDSQAFQDYARALGMDVQPATAGITASARSVDGLNLPVLSRLKLHSNASGAEPLLTAPNGDWVALRTPYQQGTLIVIATPRLLSNVGLRDQTTARFVFRQLLANVPPGATLAFDERHHGPEAADTQPASLSRLLFTTPVGWAIVYASGLVFVYVLLSGRRLGPPLPARGPANVRRTMYEHVQMLADLYRRAGQIGTARSVMARSYARRLGTTSAHAEMTSAIARIDTAQTTDDLIAAVAAADDTR
jgi:uncharacterized protein DUF4350